MTLSDIEVVRLKAADRATLLREEWEADGVLSEVRLERFPVLDLPAHRVWENNVIQTEDVDYTLDMDSGVLVFLPGTPTINTMFVFEYASTVFSDEEVDQFLTEASGSTTLAAANLLLAWAADAARIAKKESLAGGGGFGSVSITTDMRARELRESAKAYFKQYQDFEVAANPIEYLFEIAWTEHMVERALYNELIDNH